MLVIRMLTFWTGSGPESKPHRWAGFRSRSPHPTRHWAGWWGSVGGPCSLAL